MAIATIASSANAASVSGTANARVVTPIAISQTKALEFGSFASSASSGTITQAGTFTGGVTAVSGGATRSAGIFSVTGEAVSTPYTFTLPATATLTSGANTMTATLSLASGTSSRTLNASGADLVSANGSLAVSANQAAGTYAGTYTVTVNY